MELVIINPGSIFHVIKELNLSIVFEASFSSCDINHVNIQKKVQCGKVNGD